MSKVVDERVVQMSFDNRQFESNVKTSMSTLEKLKSALKFDGATKGLEDVEKASKRVSFGSLGSAIESINGKFSALEVVGITALSNITNSAVNAGKRIISALTIDPVKTGFEEYETQINAVQTILANTESKGSTLTDVNNALDQLNKYADMTIYNFTQMTRNIGTFTAAGVELDTAVSSIKGIANLAAVSGSSAQQASTAMYQLSQALAAGKIQLQDWNSVVNAGMGGEVFQTALKRTAKNMGTDIDALIEKYGTFRESLTKGAWLTSDVLTETLTQLSGAYTKADLLAKGYTEEQADEITKLAKTAVDAATKVKTFSQLWDTLTEAAQSGWTETWEIIVGDFEEAKDFLTELSDTFGALIGESAEARNSLLYDAMSSNWKKLSDEITVAGISVEDFKDKIIEVGKQHEIDVESLIADYGSIEKAAKAGALSSTILSEALIEMTGSTEEIKGKMVELGLGLDNNQESMDRLTKEGLTYAESQDILSKEITDQVKTLSKLSDEQLLNIGYTADQIVQMRELSKVTEIAGGSLDGFIKNIAVPSGRELLIDGLRIAIESLVSIFKVAKEAWAEVFPPASADQVYSAAESIRDFIASIRPSEETLDKIKRSLRGLFSLLDIFKQAITALFRPFTSLFGKFGDLGDGILNVTAALGDYLTQLNQSIKAGESFSAVSDLVSKVFGGISKGIGVLIDRFRNLTIDLSGVANGIIKIFDKIAEVVGRVFTWIKENISLDDVFTGLSIASLVKFSVKIGEFIDGLKSIFGLGGGGGVGAGFSDILDGIHDSLESFQNGLKVSSLLAIAIAVATLTSALRKISEIEPAKIVYSLAAIDAMIISLNSGFKSLTRTLSTYNSNGTLKAGIAMIAMAEAINILATAMEKLSQFDVPEIIKGLASIGGLLLELSVAVKIIGNTSGITLRTSVAILALAKACQMLGDALGTFAGFSWDEIKRGLTAMGGALLELTMALEVLSDVGGFGALLGGVGILVTVQSLEKISENLERMGNLSWDQIKRGLAAMGGALGELTIALSILSSVGGFSSVLGGTAILIVVQGLDEISENLERMGNLSWDEIGRGLAAMGGALTELALACGILGGVVGFSGIFGSAAIFLVIQGLDDTASALERFGAMTWDEISRGLAAMGGALTELALACGILGGVVGFAGLFGSGSILLLIQGLDQLADSLAKFGAMSWDEIGRGLVAMGGALLEIGVITGALGYLTNIAGLVGAGTILLAIQGLDDLAMAFQKFGSMSWDEIGRGLSAMGGALGEVALGSFLSSLSFMGGATISKISTALGDLADSMLKWKDVTVPNNLGWQLGSLAAGVVQFTLGGLGANAIAEVAQPLGVLADSVLKWGGVTVPQGLSDQLSELAWGVEKFTFGGLGASALSSAAPAIGELADSISKWENIKVPDGIESDLTAIANGILAFSWAFMGGWSLHAIVDPLAKLADSVSKWDGVKVPSTLEEDLTGLANGILAFSWAFMGGWSMSAVIDPLAKLVDSVKKWEDVRVPSTLEEDLTGLANGVLSFSWAFMGGWSLGAIVEPLGNLAGSIEKWNGVSIPDDLGDQLTSLSGGVKSFNFAGWGADAIGALAIPIGDLADGISKWTGISIPDELGNNLSSLANGVKAFNFSGWGVDTIAALAEPIGKLALEIDKWTGITIPEELGDNLSSLAGGVSAFNFSGWGVDAIAALCGPLGLLSDSVNKWAGIEVPATLGPDLSALAKGVSSFNFSGWGADTISSLAIPLGNLADSVDKWTGLTVSESLGEDLKTLATGVKNFNFAGWGGDTIGVIGTNLGILADSIEKLSGVDIAGMGSELANLSDDLNKLAYCGLTTLFTGTLKEFLGLFEGDKVTLATSNIRSLLDSLADMSSIDPSGLDNFQTILNNLGEISVSGLVKSLEDGAAAVGGTVEQIGSSIIYGLNEATLNVEPVAKNTGRSVTEHISTGIQNGLTSMASSISTGLNEQASAIGVKTEAFSNAGESLGSSLVNGFTTAFSNFASEFATTLYTLSEYLSGRSYSFENVGKAIMNSIISGVNEESGRLTSTFDTALNNTNNLISGKENHFMNSAQNLVTKFVEGIDSKTKDAETAIVSLANKLVEAIGNKKTDFQYAGKMVAEGFAKGITEYTYLAIDAAKNMAQSAINATKTELDTNSPSKVFYQIGGYVASGLANGITNGQYSVSDAGKNMASRLVESVKSFLKIRSPSVVFKEDVGYYIVEGIAEGIKKNTSAEDAAKQKAQNIATAFKAEFDKIDLAASIRDLEFSLANGEAASDFDAYQKELANYTAKQEDQVQRVYMSEQKYKAMVREFGETSQNSLEAYKELLEAQVKLSEIEKSISQLTTDYEESQLKKRKDLYDQKNSLYDLEWELTKTQNERVLGEGQKALAEIDHMQQQQVRKQSELREAIEEYNSILSEYGQDATETYDAYTNVLQQKIELAQIGNDIAKAMEDEMERNTKAYEEYQKYIKENRFKLKRKGWTTEEIEAKAREESGYDPNSLIKKMEDDVQKATVSAMSNVQKTYTAQSLATFEPLVASFSGYGEKYATAMGTGIKNKAPEVAQEGNTMVQGTITEIKSLYDSWEDAGSYLVDGFVKGIKDNIQKAADAAAQMAKEVYEAAMEELEMASPSKKFMRVGMYVDLGFAKGISDYSHEATSATSDMAVEAFDAMSQIVSAISDTINSDMDVEPTIRPVLDLSAVKTGASKLNSMFNYGQALTIGASLSKAQTPDGQNGAEQTTPTSVQFVQNNYSPKALSRIDIYRDTKNQVASFERLMKR